MDAGNCLFPLQAEAKSINLEYLEPMVFLREKTDPFGWKFEKLPGNASIIDDRSVLRESAIPSKASNPRTAPVSIYEMHLGSWRYHPVTKQPCHSWN